MKIKQCKKKKLITNIAFMFFIHHISFSSEVTFLDRIRDTQLFRTNTLEQQDLQKKRNKELETKENKAGVCAEETLSTRTQIMNAEEQ